MNVPGHVVNVPGEPFACFICQGDPEEGPFCERVSKLLAAISATDLIAYFEFLDDRRMPSIAGAVLALSNRYPGMTRDEARTVAEAWRETLSPTLPAEDRALNALEHA